MDSQEQGNARPHGSIPPPTHPPGAHPQFGEGLGPVARRVLLRLFRVLDANGSGALEYEVRYTMRRQCNAYRVGDGVGPFNAPPRPD